MDGEWAMWEKSNIGNRSIALWNELVFSWEGYDGHRYPRLKAPAKFFFPPQVQGREEKEED